MSYRKPSRVAMWLLSALLLAFVGGAGAQTKVRIDLTGRDDLTPEDIIRAVTTAKSESPSGELSRGVVPTMPGVPTSVCDSKSTRSELSRGVAPTVAVTVHFAFNSARILPAGERLLTKVGPALSSPELAPCRFRIEGHTDSIGSDQFNMKLSEKRAKRVQQYLVKAFGISGNRLVPAGRGKQEPIADNALPEGREKNRRVEFVLLQGE